MKNLIQKIQKIDNSVDLNLVVDAVRAQQKKLRALELAQAKMSLNVGDKVKITAKQGNFVGKILDIKRTRATCSVEGRPGTFNVPLRIMGAI